jgi:hypothetical protein
VGNLSQEGGRAGSRMHRWEALPASQSVPLHRGLTAVSGRIAWGTSVRREGELGAQIGSATPASQSVPLHRGLTAVSDGLFVLLLLTRMLQTFQVLEPISETISFGDEVVARGKQTSQAL